MSWLNVYKASIKETGDTCNVTFLIILFMMIHLRGSKSNKCNSKRRDWWPLENLQNEYLSLREESRLCLWPSLKFFGYRRSRCGTYVLFCCLNYHCRLWSNLPQQGNIMCRSWGIARVDRKTFIYHQSKALI